MKYLRIGAFFGFSSSSFLAGASASEPRMRVIKIPYENDTVLMIKDPIP